MAKPDLSKIYGRLNGLNNYHPFSAQTFADWASEAGDTVNITQDGKTYGSPVHKQSMVWKGKHQITMESGGKQERAPIERVSNQKTSTSAGTSSYRSSYGGFGRTQDHILYELENPETGLAMRLSMNEELAELIYTKTGINSLGQQETLMTRIEQNAEGITLEARRAIEQENELSGKITVTAGRVGLVVESKNGKNVIKSASIVAAINADGSSSALIDADHIKLTGNTTVAGLLRVDGGNLIVSKNIIAGLSGGNYIQGKTLRLVGASSSQGANVQTLSADDISEMIIKAAVSGNTLKLWKHGDSTAGTPSITFSRAISSWTWGGGSGKINVTALPQKQTKSIKVSIDGTTSITRNGTYTYTVDYENSSGDDVSTGAKKTVTVNVSGSAPVSSIDIGSIAVTPNQPSGYEGATELTQLANSIKNNRNTYVWFKVKALDANNNVLYTKNYKCASA